MQKHKIENYEREHGVGTFLPFRCLSGDEVDLIKGCLARHFSLPDKNKPMDILNKVYENSIVIDGVNAEDDSFSFFDLCGTMKLDISETVYLNWHHFNEIDEVKTGDLIKFFSDIWYPHADDLEIIDAKYRWVVSIHHSGSVSVWYDPRTWVTFNTRT